jgi:hypothetical protein
MAVVYRHIREDKNEPFYIGVGIRENRAYQKGIYRNKIWNRITNKTNYSVEILLKDLSISDALTKEIEFIKLYGRIDNKTGCLSNLTDGGEGSFGVVQSKETIKKRFESRKGYKHSDLTKLKMSKKAIGRTFSKEHINNLSKSHIGNNSANSNEVLDLKTGVFYDSLRSACTSCNIKYKTEFARIKRNSNNNRFKII